MAGKAKPAGITSLAGSGSARKSVVIILEALSGEIGTSQAAEVLGVSLSRYYQLEVRALQGMLKALEPRKRGMQKTPQREIVGLKAQKQQLEKDLRRHQSLLRAANRSLGLSSARRPKASSKGRSAKRGVRGKTVLETLRRGDLEEKEGVEDGTAQRDGTLGGVDSSQ
ncbi:MAG: hypothetical protein O2894_12260 [Planctomycetota bacterium]|nr:hypothetical protein [Planctomycetota bacterium]